MTFTCGELVRKLLATDNEVIGMLCRTTILTIFIGLFGANVVCADSIRVTLLGSGGPDPIYLFPANYNSVEIWCAGNLFYGMTSPP